jgi:fermentation-respiration switch protein FrsA (DUF1100 family)
MVKDSSSHSPRLNRWLSYKTLLVLSAVVFCLYLGIGFFMTMTLTRPHRHLNPAVSPGAQGLAFDDISFPSRGGEVTLSGWFIPTADGPRAEAAAGAPPAGASARRAVVLVHGKDSNRTRMFYGKSPEVAASLRQRGMAVLMFDLRGHGKSGDAHMTLGLKESLDVLGAVDWLRAHGYPAGGIGVLGQSMGAAATIYAAAREPAIGAVITDCGYADIDPVMKQEWRRLTGLPDIFVPATRLFGYLIMGVDVRSARPVSVIGDLAPRPVLLIHGAADKLVPVSQVYDLHGALPSSELWIIPGADHVAGFRQEPAEYLRRIDDFFDHNLPR